MGDTSAVHLETLQHPVTSGNSSNEAGCNVIAVQDNLIIYVELLCTVDFFEHLVDVEFKIRVELFEQIFE